MVLFWRVFPFLPEGKLVLLVQGLLHHELDKILLRDRAVAVEIGLVRRITD